MASRRNRRSLFTLLRWGVAFIIVMEMIANGGNALVRGIGNIAGGGRYPHRSYRETQADLAAFYDLAQNQYPDDFIDTLSEWKMGATWEAELHVLKDRIENSMRDLASVRVDAPTANRSGHKRKPGATDLRTMFSVVYNETAQADAGRMDNVVAAFRWFKEQNKLSDRDLLELVVAWIQTMPYELPEESPYGLYTPVETVARGAGDCDSKSLLGLLVLERLGYDCIIMISDHYEHAMLGVAAGTGGEVLYVGDRAYAFVEMTYPGWRIGELPPDVGEIEYWDTIQVD